MHLVTFVVGLVALTRADVSHLKHSSVASNSLADEVSIKFNSAGNDRYWWMNTKSSPFTKSDTHDTLGAFDQEHQQTHNTVHDTQQNFFLNARPQQHQQSHPRHPSNNHFAHMATLSGSPSEVNNLMQDTTQTSNIASRYRSTAKIPCFGATQVCAPIAACRNGFISERDLGLVLSQSNVSIAARLSVFFPPPPLTTETVVRLRSYASKNTNITVKTYEMRCGANDHPSPVRRDQKKSSSLTLLTTHSAIWSTRHEMSNSN